ncbi:MAG: cytochrome c [Caldilineaceae bacterium]
MFRFRTLFFVSLLISLLILAACGGNDDPPPPVADPPTATSAPAAPAVAAAPVGDAKNGEALFNQTCIACHGPGGVGVKGLGKDMTKSTFIAGLNDTELLEFVKKGRDTSDPLNTTKVAMPPKGGNPALDDPKLLDIIAYIRTINKP